MANPSSSYTSTAKRIPTTTFDSILPSHKISTWEQEDAAAKKKRSSAELAAKAKTAVSGTVRSALKKADQLKKTVKKVKVRRDTDKQIKKAEKESKKEKAEKEREKEGR